MDSKVEFPGPKIVATSGGIAVGKSTFGEMFTEQAEKYWPDKKVLFEEEGVNLSLLSAYIKDKKKYGAHFQVDTNYF